jgi:hypothetical protein
MISYGYIYLRGNREQEERREKGAGSREIPVIKIRGL